MNEGAAALIRVRFFTYLIFIFDVLLLFRGLIEGVIHYTGNRVLYGLILMVAMQIIMVSMHIVKFATTLPAEQKTARGKNRKQAEQMNRHRQNALRFSARIRYFSLFEFVPLVILALNAAQIHSEIVETGAVLVSVVFVVLILRDLTLLQKGEY